jgi:AcrR family transcriptional regulator
MADKALLKLVAERGSTPTDRKQLQRYDWLLKALEIFIDEGIEAVRITRLADELNVTRGSFYWHFSNREDLIEALVDYWKNRNTNAIVDSVATVERLCDGVFQFFETCFDNQLFDPRLDLAIREWARRSAEVRQQLDAADEIRVQALTDFYRRFGYQMPEAFIRARVIYFAQIGFYALDVHEDMAARLDYTEAYFLSFTGKKLDPADAEQFKTRIRTTYGDHS